MAPTSTSTAPDPRSDHRRAAGPSTDLVPALGPTRDDAPLPVTDLPLDPVLADAVQTLVLRWGASPSHAVTILVEVAGDLDLPLIDLAEVVVTAAHLQYSASGRWRASAARGLRIVPPPTTDDAWGIRPR